MKPPLKNLEQDSTTRKLGFEERAESEYIYWENHDEAVAEFIHDLLDEVLVQPFEGRGEPKELERDLKGCWSRRIDKEHRLVYRVTDDKIIVVSCKGHY